MKIVTINYLFPVTTLCIMLIFIKQRLGMRLVITVVICHKKLYSAALN